MQETKPTCKDSKLHGKLRKTKSWQTGRAQAGVWHRSCCQSCLCFGDKPLCADMEGLLLEHVVALCTCVAAAADFGAAMKTGSDGHAEAQPIRNAPGCWALGRT